MPAYKHLAALIAAALLLSSGVGYAEPQYLGLRGCPACHKVETQDWRQSAHAKAFELLAPTVRGEAKTKAGLDPTKDYRSEPRCLPCHTTGYGRPGGFTGIDSTPQLAGLGCESCHGPGSEFRDMHRVSAQLGRERRENRAASQPTQAEQACIDCHTHKDNPFQPQVDAKYRFELREALKAEASYHVLRPVAPH